MTGLPWLAEQGLLGAPIGITNTYQVGIVRDAITAMAVRDGASQAFHLPVVAETYDGWLSDIQGFTLTQEHAFAAFDSAVGGCAIAEGNVGGGTGMICHEFKGGTGTASRVVVENGDAIRSARWCRRIMARAICCAWMACLSAGRSGPTSCRRIARAEAQPATGDGRFHHRRSGDRRASHSDPVPAACPPGHCRASRGSAASVQTEAATSLSRSPPAIIRPERQDQQREDARARCDDEPVSSLGRGNRGGDPQRNVHGRDHVRPRLALVHALPLDLLQEVMRRYRPEQRA